MLSAFSTFLNPSSETRSKLSVHLIPKNMRDAPPSGVIEDMKAFKAQLQVSNAPEPVDEFAELLHSRAGFYS